MLDRVAIVILTDSLEKVSRWLGGIQINNFLHHLDRERMILFMRGLGRNIVWGRHKEGGLVVRTQELAQAPITIQVIQKEKALLWLGDMKQVEEIIPLAQAHMMLFKEVLQDIA